ncbi:MAG: GNAT family N-acetyltransferase [Gemmatales bacterium]
MNRFPRPALLCVMFAQRYNPAMSLHPQLSTPRLLLRPWCEADRAPFAALNADPLVMEYFPARLTREASDAMVDRIMTHFSERGFGFWAVEIPGITPFAGFIGLGVPRYETHFTPSIEVGWRLAAQYWNRGYATEGAREALRFGFGQLRLQEIVSFTAVGNTRSRRVMEKLGMNHHPDDDFPHPLLAEDHPLRRHVLYRMTADNYMRIPSESRSNT